MRRTTLSLLAMAAASLNGVAAEEGMWTPEQAPEIARDMKRLGLKLKPEDMADLTGFPMGAIISLGGCSASFVSDQGLVATNHHCVRGSVQYNSTAENNYLDNGFLAQSLGDELPAAPGSRVYVTVGDRDATEDVVGGLAASLSGRDRYQAIEDRTKQLIEECESDPGHRCQVASFYGGASYRLIKRLEIRDVRLVYVPADSIGKYGGDIDNWMWPRHTGDFAFYRAYVAPDGSAADYAEENVPYLPEHVLKVSSGGLKAGDFVMAAGYPGRTSRYRRLGEVHETFDWYYPTWIETAEKRISLIEATAPDGSDARVKYESLLAGLNNYHKNRIGQIKGARRAGLAERRAEHEAKLNAWIAADASRETFAEAVRDLDQLIEEQNAKGRQSFWYDYASGPQLLSAARQLYRLAKEKDKPDSEREPGYQDRDLTRTRQQLTRIDRRFDPAVDRELWLYFLEQYMAQPAEARIAAFDEALGLPAAFDRAALERSLARLYENTDIDDQETRLSWMERQASAFEASDDPFIQLAVALYNDDMAREEDSKNMAGQLQQARASYMQALIAWNADQGLAAYPDANSTLRITYGSVMGGSPMDGLIYEPFTRLEGITAKDTGEAPFNSPSKMLDLIEAGDYADYDLKSIGSVPVNFLSDLDSTGGNSGSATLNARGELVGLLFDGTIESVNSDWDFDPRTTRTIHVDSRYMLWVMEKVDGADRLIDEMQLVKRR